MGVRIKSLLSVEITGVAAVLAAGCADDDAPAPPRAAPSAGAAAPFDQARSYGVLRRDARPSDALPPGAQITTPGFDLVRGAERRVAPPGSKGRHWVVPGEGGVCLADDAGGGLAFACNETKAALAEGGFTTSSAEPDSTGGISVHGLLPDGATAAVLYLHDGSERTIRTYENVLVAEGLPAVPLRVEWRDANGAHSAPLAPMPRG